MHLAVVAKQHGVAGAPRCMGSSPSSPLLGGSVLSMHRSYESSLSTTDSEDGSGWDREEEEEHHNNGSSGRRVAPSPGGCLL